MQLHPKGVVLVWGYRLMVDDVESIFPKMTRLRQAVHATADFDLHAALDSLPIEMKRGGRVALAVGSRGISNLAEIIRAVIERIKSQGAEPFIVPAMGSHGGATAEGQLAILAKYGITPESMGVSFRPSMETTCLGQTAAGTPVFFSTAALNADVIVPINRVKPHTDFQGSIGSGLAKMLVIGLGKHRGAAAHHKAALKLGLEEVIRSGVATILASTPVFFGLAIVEDALHATAHIECVKADKLIGREEQLLVRAKSLMPRLPFKEIDLLIVDRIGKNISGAGMDPNITGRSVHGYSAHLPEAVEPRVQRIFVRDLSEESQGNAIGIGMADFTTSRLVAKIDYGATFTNALTSLTPQSAKIPIHFETDRQTIQHALSTTESDQMRDVRVVRIRDTLSLAICEISECYASEVASRSDLQLTGTFAEMQFDCDGNLCPFEYQSI